MNGGFRNYCPKTCKRIMCIIIVDARVRCVAPRRRRYKLNIDVSRGRILLILVANIDDRITETRTEVLVIMTVWAQTDTRHVVLLHHIKYVTKTGRVARNNIILIATATIVFFFFSIKNKKSISVQGYFSLVHVHATLHRKLNLKGTNTYVYIKIDIGVVKSTA